MMYFLISKIQVKSFGVFANNSISSPCDSWKGSRMGCSVPFSLVSTVLVQMSLSWKILILCWCFLRLQWPVTKPINCLIWFLRRFRISFEVIQMVFLTMIIMCLPWYTFPRWTQLLCSPFFHKTVYQRFWCAEWELWSHEIIGRRLLRFLLPTVHLWQG